MGVRHDDSEGLGPRKRRGERVYEREGNRRAASDRAFAVLESQLSYPILSYYRSQHDNQSWLAALTTVLDSCAVVIAGVEDVDSYQARLTFAIT